MMWNICYRLTIFPNMLCPKEFYEFYWESGVFTIGYDDVWSMIEDYGMEE